MFLKKHKVRNSLLSLLIVVGMLIPHHIAFAAVDSEPYVKPGTKYVTPELSIIDTATQLKLAFSPNIAVLDSWKDLKFTAVNTSESSNDEARLLTYETRFKYALLHYMSNSSIDSTEMEAVRDFTTDDIRGTYSTIGTSLSNYYKGTYEEPGSSTEVGNWNVVGLEMTGIDETTYDLSANGPLFAYFYTNVVNSDKDEEAFNFLADLVFEYHYYYYYFRPYVREQIDTTGSVDGTTYKGLQALQAVAEINSDLCANNEWTLFPVIKFMWELDPDGNGSLQDLYNEVESLASTIDFGAVPEYNKVYTQPLTEFYNVTYTEGVSTIDLVSEKLDYVTLSDNIHKGIKYSATYIPMQTNLYSPITVAGYDSEFLDNFHYKYGFMRKALLKDTSATSAVDYYNSSGSSIGTLEVCTLRDFIELGDNDLTLYLDDNFYNADQAWEEVQSYNTKYIERLKAAAEQLGILSEDILKPAYDSDENLESYYDTIAYLVGDGVRNLSSRELSNLQAQLSVSLNATDITSWESKIKTDEYSQYSSSLRSTLIAIGNGDYKHDANELDFLLSDNHDYLVLSSYYIKDYLDCVTTRVEDENEESDVKYEYFTYDEYTPMLSYAFTSAIYRDAGAFKIAQAVSGLDTPVFIASDNLCQIEGVNEYYQNSLLNYALVRNLESMSQITSSYVTDLDAPVFMDIYGNIITESGTVVIPAACNATLYYSDFNHNNTALGLYSCYGNDYYVPSDVKGAVTVLSNYFSIDEENEIWTVDSVDLNVNGITYNLNNLALYTDSTKQAAQDAFYSYITKTTGSTSQSYCQWSLFVNIINEVMRGAPIESIDYVQEGIKPDNGTATGRVAAIKLEELLNNISSSNSLFSLPDFNSIEDLDYYIAFAMKLLIIATVVAVIVTIFLDGVSNSLGFRTIFKILGSVIVTFVVLTALPALFQFTYYASNKLLLQDEVTRLAIYNLEKRYSGVEVGASEIITPDSKNKLTVQLDWVDIPWYEELDAVLFGSSIDAITHVKEDAYTESLVSNQPDVLKYNDGVYMDVDTIFDSLNIDYTFNTKTGSENSLYLTDGSSTQTLSFYSPYYVFLEALTTNINYYNYVMGTYNYTTKLQSGNRLKTVGLCKDYFTSQAFMENSYDILHLNEVYQTGVAPGIDMPECFTAEDSQVMSESMWYLNLDADNLDKRIRIVDDYCRDFIAENRDLLDKVTDETFIKVMALSMSMKYNQVFGVSSANCFEIQNLDYNDLLRLCVASDAEAMVTSPMSYARFVYFLGGETCLYAAAILAMAMFVGSYIKPICTVVSFLAIVLHVFTTKVVLRRKFSSIRGYITTTLLLCGINIFHAILLKLSTKLPGLGIPMLGCIIFIICFQAIYLLLLAYITGITITYWRDFGEAKYDQQAEVIRKRFTNDSVNYLDGDHKHHENNWDYYQDLVDQHRERSRR